MTDSQGPPVCHPEAPASIPQQCADRFAELGTRLGEDIEALHDMRVATRRMRAAFRVFGEHFEPKAVAPYLKGLKPANLINEYLRVNCYSIADDAGNLGVENTGWDKVQPELTVLVDYRMPGIITTGKTYHYSCFFSQKVDYLTLPLISPLRSNNSNNRHYFSFQI